MISRHTRAFPRLLRESKNYCKCDRFIPLCTHARSRERKSVFPDGDPLVVSYQGTDFELETLFDLVGWIFSVTGQIPKDATAANYYYPLVILYCQWCRTLSANSKKSRRWYRSLGSLKEAPNEFALEVISISPRNHVKTQQEQRDLTGF